MTESSKDCANCKHHQTVVAADKTFQTQCRKELPKSIAQMLPQGPGQIGVFSQRLPWPVMEKGDWCGEYEPQLN